MTRKNYFRVKNENKKRKYTSTNILLYQQIIFFYTENRYKCMEVAIIYSLSLYKSMV